MSDMAIHFYDAATSQNVPSGVHAAVYADGLYAWSESEVQRMGSVFRISVESAPHWAANARALDVESGAASVGDVVPFIRERMRLHYDDSTIYVNRSNWDACKRAVKNARLPEPLWWVATLDGTQDVPGAWAVQYYGGMRAPYDLSVLHGVNNFRNPRHHSHFGRR